MGPDLQLCVYVAVCMLASLPREGKKKNAYGNKVGCRIINLVEVIKISLIIPLSPSLAIQSHALSVATPDPWYFALLFHVSPHTFALVRS